MPLAETEVKHTPGPWELELREEWPFGIKITAGDKSILEQHAICFSSVQKTRRDTELGVGFDYRDSHPGFRRDTAIAAIAEQDANARLIAAAPELLEALKEFMDMWGSRDAHSTSKRAQARRAAMWAKAQAAISKALPQSQTKDANQ